MANPQVDVAPTSAQVGTSNLTALQDGGRALTAVLDVVRQIEANQAAPSPQAQQTLSGTATGSSRTDAQKLITGAIALAPTLVTSGKAIVAALGAAGPVGWAVGAVVLGVGAFFYVKERRRVALRSRSGPLWWEIERQGWEAVRDKCRDAISTSFFPRFSQYWVGRNGIAAELLGKNHPDAAKSVKDRIGTGPRDAKLDAFVFIPFRQIGAWDQITGTWDTVNGWSVPRGLGSYTTLQGGQAYSGFIPYMFASVVAPSSQQLWSASAEILGNYVRDLVQWSFRYHDIVARRLHALEQKQFPVLLYSPELQQQVGSYEYFARSATLVAIATQVAFAWRGEYVSRYDTDNIHLLARSYSADSAENKWHRAKVAGSVYLLCLSAAAAGIDLAIVGQYLKGERNDLPAAIIQGASSGSSSAQSGGSVIQSPPPPPSSPPPSAPPRPVSSSSSSSFENWAAIAAAALGAFLLLRRKKR